MRSSLIHKMVLGLSAVVLATGCSRAMGVSGTSLASSNSSSPTAQGTQYIVRSQVTTPLTTGGSDVHADDSTSGLGNPLDIPDGVTLTNAPYTAMTVDLTQLVANPVITNADIDLGYVQVDSLTDNDLFVCADPVTSAAVQCGTAILRMYTIGQPGPGLWNPAQDYGVPLLAGLTFPLTDFGVGPSNAVILQTYSIPSTEHVLQLSDFSPVPRFDINADFTNAGAGTFSTTLVFEYALSN